MYYYVRQHNSTPLQKSVDLVIVVDGYETPALKSSDIVVVGVLCSDLSVST